MLGLKIKVILGKIELKAKPLLIFDRSIIKFLNELHIKIKSNKDTSKYSDLATFGFWCREANINKISKLYPNSMLMVGRGKVFHVTPSNVPMNFAYSFAFGLLSGNTNLVRLPSKNFKQIKILCDIIDKISKQNKFAFILNHFCLFQYDRSDKISQQMSINADARLIWGGDDTINQFRNYKTQPRCIDLNFANRHSVSIIKTNSLLKLKKQEWKNLIQKFYNDSYLMDQQGCSSPQSIIWIGKNNKKIISLFWELLLEYIKNNYENDIAITNQKISLLAQSAVNSSTSFKTKFDDIRIIRLKIKNLSSDIQNIKAHYGTFGEINVTSLEKIKNIFTKKSQTVTYFGLDKIELRNFIVKKGILGIDRIVIVGRAHDMGPIWDGHDIIYSLSRIISN